MAGSVTLPDLVFGSKWRGFSATFSSTSGECDPALVGITVELKNLTTGQVYVIADTDQTVGDGASEYTLVVAKQMLPLGVGVICVKVTIDNGDQFVWLIGNFNITEV